MAVCVGVNLEWNHTNNAVLKTALLTEYREIVKSISTAASCNELT